MDEQYIALSGNHKVAEKVRVANRFFPRAIGLLRKKRLDPEEALLILPCRQIHTIFMRFPIDALFLTKSGEIVHIEESMQPGHISPSVPDSFQVLELKGGIVRAKGLSLSDQIDFI